MGLAGVSAQVSGVGLVGANDKVRHAVVGVPPQVPLVDLLTSAHVGMHDT
jgi:hypothetical protein